LRPSAANVVVVDVEGVVPAGLDVVVVAVDGEEVVAGAGVDKVVSDVSGAATALLIGDVSFTHPLSITVVITSVIADNFINHFLLSQIKLCPC